jgi:hypothetical protein
MIYKFIYHSRYSIKKYLGWWGLILSHELGGHA